MKHLKDIKNKIKWQKYNDPQINWHLYYTYKPEMVDESFVETFMDKINWRFFSAGLTTPIVNNIDFLTKYQDKVDWEMISFYGRLNLHEEILEMFPDKIHWNIVSRYVHLTEQQIEKFKDRLNFNILNKRYEYEN